MKRKPKRTKKTTKTKRSIKGTKTMSEKTEVTESKKIQEPPFTVFRGPISKEMQKQLEEGGAEVLVKAHGFDKTIDGVRKAKEQEETEVKVHYDFVCSPLDGILAINRAMAHKYGYTEPLREGWFGSQPPTRLSIKTGPDTEVQAYAGMIRPPAWDYGYVSLQPQRPMALQVTGVVKKKFEAALNEIMDDARRRVKTESIYRGKAVELNLDYLQLLQLGHKFDPVAFAPKFMDLSNLEDLILPRDIESELETEILAVIRHADDFRYNKIPISYGCLFTGPKGTGKTLTASHIAKACLDSGFSFFFLKTPIFFLDAFEMAQFYGPSVLFSEDAESVFGGERTPLMNRFLEAMDGVGSKGNEVMSLWTSNNPEQINEYFLRGRRLGNEIKYRQADADAAARFVERNAKEFLSPDVELDRVGVAFNGLVCADITEGIIKAKKLAVNKFGRHIRGKVTTEMLCEKGDVMRRMRGLQSRVTIHPDTLNVAAVRAGDAVKRGHDVPPSFFILAADYLRGSGVTGDRKTEEAYREAAEKEAHGRTVESIEDK